MALESLSTLSNALADAAAVVGSSVVRVEARHLPSSGVAWAPDVIVTAAHTLEHDDVEIGLPDGNSAKATVIGRDLSTDVAALKVQGAKLSPAPWTDGPFALRVGNLVLAVSRPGRSVRGSLGIVNAISEGEWRTSAGGKLDRYMETDIALRPGFSGSALVDAQGRVAALNTVGIARGAAGAIPASTVRRVVEALQREGGIPRGYLGVSTLPARLPDALAEKLGQSTALLVASVDPQGPAGKAGLIFGDAIAAIDGRALRHPAELLEILDETSVGKAVKLKVVRAGAVRDFDVDVCKREARP